MSTQAQLRIAARIHYALKHQLGEGIDVAAMLRSPAEASEVLFVCDASGKDELIALAHQFRVAGQLALNSRPGAAPRGDAPQDTAWGLNTSGFGISQAAELAPASSARPATAAATPKGWLHAAWLRRDGRK